MKIRRLALILAVALIIACQGKSTSTAEGTYWPEKEFAIRSPSKVGISSKQLSAMEKHISNNLPMMSSIMIMKHGYIAYEKYFKGQIDDLRSLHSETKSVISILLGIDLGEEWKNTIDMPITTLLPELDPSGSSPASRISLRHVLTMSSGLEDDGGMGTLNLESIKSILSREYKNGPGEVFAYNGTNPDMISIALTRRNDKKASDFAKEMLFRPLGIELYSWEESYGFSKGAYGLSLRTRDMAKLGYLYLRKGKWRQEQVVPESWVAESTRKQIDVGETGTLTKYGFLWWTGNFSGHAGFFAFGHGGQSIVAIPDLDMVVVTTTTDSGIPEKYISVIEEYIIPATAK